MSGPDDLLRKLGALSDASARYGSYGRIISEGGMPSPVQSILNEVSETVLAQDLTFRFGEAGTIVLVVSGRRVLAVRSIEGLVMPAVAEQLAGKPLSMTPDATQRALMALLMQLDLMPETVETTSQDGAPFEAPPDAGLSPERIASLVGVTYPVSPPTAMDRFRALLPTSPEHFVLIEADGDGAEAGDAARIGQLRALAEALGIAANVGAAPQKLSIIGQQSGQSGFIGAAVEKDSALIWALNSQDIGASVAAFHKTFGV